MFIHKPKIFIIGLPKTGLTSLGESLRILGLKCIQLPKSIEQIEKHESACDLPITSNFEFLDSYFPQSKFILSTRRKEQWLKSSESHWMRHLPLIKGDPIIASAVIELYKTLLFDKHKFSLAYDRHEKRVINYFQDRPDDLLIINIFDEINPWVSLCNFTSFKKPQCSFPSANQAKSIDAIVLRALSVNRDPQKVATNLNLSFEYVNRLYKSRNLLINNQDSHV